MTIGDKIKQRRLELGMTQEELAHKMGYSSRTSINKLELNERNLPLKKIKQLADILNTTPEYLMDLEPPEGYYTDKESAEIAQEIFDNHQLRLLFDEARDASPEDLQTAYTMLLALKRKEHPHD